MTKIVIKPHHLLDIYKLHGAGINHFVPDLVYGHDFYKVGNLILNHQVTSVTLTSDADQICVPCNFCKNGICNDTFDHYGTKTIKDEYNKNLDRTIISLLRLQEGQQYSYTSFFKVLTVKVTESFINQVWNQNLPEDNQLRYQRTIAGITMIEQAAEVLPPGRMK